ncbi:signal peptidase I [Gemella bergeri ATCC 700627]|uniref:Signal peptidase I n=1 Tax=Gemella bergeri ATCC 700627 TaxID=1321820 RepID=U2QUY5_9BACL|nr:signal peptidase I [Gemella bergeri]ERK60004.1 signal peptidase I [Gemella bergeri ATCC 700627]
MTVRFLREILEWIVVVVVSIFIYLVLSTYVIAPFTVKGHSMDYTFADNDKVFVNKLSKNYKRGDEVVFHANETDDYIKRIIGVPGDTIEYKNDVLYVNGQKVDEPYLEQKIKEAKTQGNSPLTPDFNIEYLSSTKSKTVPEGTYFVMGDNRQHSTDSRVFGFVKKEAMIGKVSLRYYPLKSFKFF